MKPNTLSTRYKVALVCAGALFVASTFLRIADEIPRSGLAVFVNPAWSFWAHGDFSTTLMKGVSGYGPLSYWHGPLYLMSLIPVVGLFGTQLLALRLWTAILGAVTMFFTYRLAVQLYDSRTAAISTLMLALSYPLLAASRLMRPELLEASLGLAGLLIILTGE